MIGLYDIDLWHGKKPVPNLELMKIYNYYYKKGDRVVMLKPEDDITPFSHIFYFKEKTNTIIKNSLDLSNEKCSILGTGFYGKTPCLKPEIHCLPPAYEPYDIYSYKLKVSKGYDVFKRSSLVRVETNDYAGFNKDNKNIYIADSNFLYSAGAESFLQENKNHNFLFFNPLLAKDRETALLFSRYSILFNRDIVIDFPFDKEFFLENIKEKFIFPCKYNGNERVENFLLRTTKMALIYKNKNVYFRINGKFPNTPAAQYINQWIRSPQRISYAELFKDNTKALKELNGLNTELRLLLKQNPLKININLIDLNKNL